MSSSEAAALHQKVMQNHEITTLRAKISSEKANTVQNNLINQIKVYEGVKQEYHEKVAEITEKFDSRLDEITGVTRQKKLANKIQTSFLMKTD